MVVAIAAIGLQPTGTTGRSVGVATWDGTDDGAELIARADGAMYRQQARGQARRLRVEATAA